jgi:hypothetical protein
VELEPGLEGLLHISEISDQKIEKPEDTLKVGQEVEVKILRVDSEERKIGLSLKRAQWAAEEVKREEERANRAERRGLRGGLEGGEDTRGLGKRPVVFSNCEVLGVLSNPILAPSRRDGLFFAVPNGRLGQPLRGSRTNVRNRRRL